MELKDIKKIVEESFKKHFTKEEELIYVGGSEDIKHCGYVITDKECYEIIAEFQVSGTGIYNGTLRRLGKWYLNHFGEFEDEIIDGLYKVLYMGEHK